ncbi:hypothetical protein L1286_23950 [Pseudoalteromonas sp. SMS1]|uniref:hypothetical protein n=1 Tax=Pseudoalteromonas sp. SMS1 TaxID=2908894 RepID=UPI001F333ADA|nr:hypothetical protein [Pseudoalteromonas sp. SMS1]MCF2860519.1 hypothetical protein [Pseudoalteromonas sp. SMS1]
MVNFDSNLLKELSVLVYFDYIKPVDCVSWCDSMILEGGVSEDWIFELSLLKTNIEVATRLMKEVNSRGEDFLLSELSDTGSYYVAILYLKYSSDEISWGRFLRMICQKEELKCYSWVSFPNLYQNYMDSTSPKDTEFIQAQLIYEMFEEDILGVKRVFLVLKRFIQVS